MNKTIFLLCVLFIAAGITAASFLVHPITLTSTNLAEIKSNCITCHKVPKIKDREEVHQAHTFLQCGKCHIGAGNSEEVEEKTVNNSVCVSCHTKTDYASAVAMHDAHSTTACTACHTESPGLAAADNTHTILRWTGIVLGILVAFGLLLNFIVARVRLLRKKQ